MANLAAVPDLDAELDALYGTSLEGFIGRRWELVRRLRAAGLREQAAAMEKLRKPSLAVWVVNQLARTEPDLMQRLVTAAGRLAAAPSDRDAAGAHRQALRQLAAKAVEVAPSVSDSVRQRAAVTLRNASIDPQAREDLARGRLGAARSDAGFELVAALGLPADARAKKPTRSAELERLKGEQRAVRAQIGTLKADAKQAAKEAAAARREVDKAQAEADKIAKEIGAKKKEIASLQKQLRALRQG